MLHVVSTSEAAGNR